MWQTRFPLVFAAACILLFVVTAALSVYHTSSTWDDAPHITGGVSQWQTGEPRLNADHPPLARLWGALPVLFMDVPPLTRLGPGSWEKADLTGATGDYFGVIEDRLLWPSRLTMLIISVLLGCLLYAWGVALHGRERVWLPLALYAFCPPLLANAPLVTTDLAATTFIFAAVFSWWRYLNEPSKKNLAWVCLSVTAAFASKHTAMLLVPLLLLLGSISLGRVTVIHDDFGRRLRIVGFALLAIGVTTVVGLNMIYFFDGFFLTPPEYLERSSGAFTAFHGKAEILSRFWPSWLPVPLPYIYVCGVLSLMGNVGEFGSATYFLGQAGYGGWSNYFLMLLLIKLPIPSLILIGLGVTRAVSRLPRDWWNILFLMVPPILLVLMASNGKMQIGVRHILPAFPFLFLLAGYALHYPLRRWKKIAVGGLVAMSGFSTLAIYPNYLMYFNFFGGGAGQGWRISVTGDDYGQGDAELGRWLQNRGIREVAFGPFGWGGVVLNRAGIAIKPIPCEDTGELVAIHAGQLLLTYDLPKKRCYDWMLLREPDQKIGYSIFIYNSKNRPQPKPPVNLSLFSQALKLQLSGQNQAAIPLYQDYLQQEPNYYQAHFNLGCALMDANQCAVAIPEFKRTLELWPGYQEAHHYLAKCYRNIGQLEQAQWHEQKYLDNR
ncbi:MAG: glycosyltransferase family 39 protein [Proteobacteria bacterium]|nr:glycosyltransferase family 39 protein [Pseudomonadota bacterium]